MNIRTLCSTRLKHTVIPAMATSLLLTSASALAQDITYQVNGEEYQGYYVSAGTNAPLVLLLHDWDGLTDYEKKRADMLQQMGYSVFAADLFGKGIRPTEVKDKRQHTGELYKDREKMRRLMQGALKTAQQQGGNLDNTVAMGYCFGGAAALELARSGATLKGFATFHGGLKTPAGQNYQNTLGKLLILHGSADTAIPMEQFSNLTVELENNGVQHEMITYSGAPHAFTVFGSPRYQETADKKSWRRFSEFLEETTQL
jgi:dienelactone hydrolase